MVKKAATLKSLSDLGLDNVTKTSVISRCGNVDKAVKYGRHLAFVIEEKPHLKKSTPRANLIFIKALKEAGFILPYEDIKIALALAEFYKDVFYFEVSLSLPSNIREMSNEIYEDFKPVPKKDISRLKKLLKEELSTEGYYAIIHSYGLNGKTMSKKELKNALGISDYRLRKLINDSLDSLHKQEVIKWIFDSIERHTK